MPTTLYLQCSIPSCAFFDLAAAAAGWLPLSLLGLLLAAGRGPTCPRRHIWVLAVNGGLTIGDANTLRFMAQGPVAGALAVSGNRKRVFGLDNATGRLFEIHTKTLAVTPLLS